MEEVGWWILVGLLWLAACWLLLVYMSVPLTLAAVAAGLSVGMILASVGYLRVFGGAEDARVVASPAGTVPRGAAAPFPYWDDVWPGYLTAQLERDIMCALAWPSRKVAAMWGKSREWASPRRVVIAVALPVVPPPVGFLIAVTAGAYGAWLMFAAASEAVVVVPRLARWAAITALRAGDSSVRWWRGAAATCPRCRGVTHLPAYRCKSRRCDGIHRDVRPGRLGAWYRICHCGVRLPSTVLRAASVMTPVCPACEYPLHERAGVTPDARIAISGGPATGKTQLLMSAMAEMTDGQEAPAAWEPADEFTTTWLRDARKRMDRWPGRGPAPTAELEVLTLREIASHQQRYVHVIDAGGQHFVTAARDPALRYLGTTRRHLLVLDPTTIPSVRDRIDPTVLTHGPAEDKDSDIPGADTSSAVTELPYQLLVGHLNRFGARTRCCSLAVVITKADLLAKQDLGPKADPPRTTTSQALKEWLCAMNLRNLVESADRDFGKVRYFLVGLGVNSADPVSPLTWLIKQHRRGAKIK
jgi:hypothetical protein